MTSNEIITIYISSLSLLLSLISLILSAVNMLKIERISYGEFELSIRESISSAKNKVAEAIKNSTDNNPYNSQIVKFAIEELLNAYEEACAKYIDKKVDKKRFKKMFSDEIKKVVESNDLAKFFQFGSKYEAIKKVYNKWFDLEK